ncbi:MAG TPA: hypothetical protein VMT81_00840 [Candidatus Paceibacterota bacterium]|nr:hypothetical protein [Candidatus Paceibacterota bacterium]
MNKKKMAGWLAGFAVLAAVPAFAAAAGAVVNGGLGQSAADPQQFGVAVCNNGSQALAAPVPVTVAANGASVTVSSQTSIASKGCAYSYVAYSQFGMAAGKAYTVSVSVGSDNATYTVTVPGAAGTQASAGQPDDFLANIGSVFTNFFGALKGLFGR